METDDGYARQSVQIQAPNDDSSSSELTLATKVVVVCGGEKSGGNILPTPDTRNPHSTATP